MSIVTNRQARNWRSFFDERVKQALENGLSQETAEANAFESCVAKWLDTNPSTSAAGRCQWCGQAETTSAPVMPYGASWVHSECWRAWHESRRKLAVEALGAMGLQQQEH